MKRFFTLTLITLVFTSCESVYSILEGANGSMGSHKITQSEAATGLKQALEIGVQEGTSFLGQSGGFLNNKSYRVLLPPEVRDVEDKIRNNVLVNSLVGPVLDDFIAAMNRGAEKAMSEAKPIFVNAIKEMTITDAIKVVKGGEGAATAYLRSKTSDSLKMKFMPVVNESLKTLNINELWTKVTKSYNMVTQENVTTDLNAYVTEQAMNALFTEIKKQEDEIREDPLKRTTDILKKVFDYADTRS